MGNRLLEVVRKQKLGKQIGIYSACTSNKYALMAVMQRAQITGQPALIEATSNQVDQNGGYTGMTPYDYSQYVYKIADQLRFPHDQIILGGDHLGPLTQVDFQESQAMEYAAELVRQYVAAGFTKIHLDTSMKLATDDLNKPLDDFTIARRGAHLCSVAENAFFELLKTTPNAQPPVYIIGSEVPIPGGAQEGSEKIHITTPEDSQSTISAFEEAFHNKKIDNAWKRVIGLVVQPGVEFSDSEVFVYNRQQAKALTDSLHNWTQGIFEGHSTDYQPREALRNMVEDGIAILKVGPALTYAFREALFSLDLIEQELNYGKTWLNSNFQSILEQTMQEHPHNWEKHYRGNSQQLYISRKYSYSDRCRYYLNEPLVNQSINKLINNINQLQIPMTLLSQYMPRQYESVRAGNISLTAELLIMDRIGDCIDNYLFAVMGK